MHYVCNIFLSIILIIGIIVHESYNMYLMYHHQLIMCIEPITCDLQSFIFYNYCFSLGGPRYKPLGVSRGSPQSHHFNEMYHTIMYV